MGFFDDVLLTDDVPSAPQVQTVQPAHLGPPAGWVLPTVLPSVRLLGRSDNARVALVGLRCWPDGVSMELHLMCRELQAGSAARDHWSFRFGALYSDGRRVAVGDSPADSMTTVRSADGLVLRPMIGGGATFHRRWGFYLWPLPPKGRLTLVVDWPAEGIPETFTELDAGEIRSAAARAVVMWRDLPISDQSADVPG